MSSPTPRRPTPSAAPAGRRPVTSWSGSPIARPRRSGIDRAEIRRRNLIPPEAMPYKTPIGPTYDCGDFPKIFARALALADYDGFAQRRVEAERRGRLRGIGIACYVESSGVAPSRFAGANGARVGFYEAASIRVEPDGAVRAMLGTHNHGQGHATTYAQILASKLGVAVENVEVSEGDTDAVPHGTGTFGSRSIAVGGCALDRAGDKIVTKGKLIAGHLLEAAATDVDFADGSFVVAGTDRRVSLRGGRPCRLCPAQLSARDARAGAAGDRGLRSAELRLQQRRPCVRARDRSADRPHRDRRLLGRRRRRHRHQSDDRRGPDPRRPRARPRPGAARALRL